MNELELFKIGIKPAILIPEKSISRVKIDADEYYKGRFRKGIILSHKELPLITDFDNIKLGIVLGYYPKSCEVLYASRVNRENRGNNEFIYFGGIHFNTAHLFDEALEWCKGKYLEKMLLYSNNIKCNKIIIRREKSKVIREIREIKI